MKKLLFFILFLLPFMASSQLTVVKPIVSEYRFWALYSDGYIWGYSNNGGTYIKKWKRPTGRTWSFVQGAFNYFNAIDDQGYVWQSRTFNVDPTDSIWRIDTDTTGGAFNNNIFIDSYSLAQITIRSDSTAWYGGRDVYNLFYTGGSLVTSTGTNMAFTQLSPAGLHFKKIAMGGTAILGLTGDGKVYQWTPGGSRTPTLMSTPRPAIDIAISAVDVKLAIVPDATGAQNMGYPFVWGSSTSLYGGSTTFSTPTSIKSLWGITVPIKKISVDWNTIHYIDSTGKLYGCGWNVFGEVGNGQEFIGHWDYNGFPGYGWDLGNNEHATGIPVQIGSKSDWVDIFSTPWFGFYKYAMDSRDSVYCWGRDKAAVLSRGYSMNINTNPKPGDGNNVDQYNPNTIDVLTPTLVTPISARIVQYNFTPPTLSAGSNTTIYTSSTTLTASGHSALVFAPSQPAPNGVDTIGYHYNAWTWSQVSGPSCTIVSPTAQSTIVTGMTNGTYVFQVLAADDHSGLHKSTVTLTVSIVPTNIIIRRRCSRLKIISQ